MNILYILNICALLVANFDRISLSLVQTFLSALPWTKPLAKVLEKSFFIPYNGRSTFYEHVDFKANLVLYIRGNEKEENILV